MLSDESRLQLLLLLARHDELNVTSLQRAVGQSQAATSHHLNLLRLARVVSFRREGKHNFYRLDCDHVRELLTTVEAE
jgi:ArsR family transcriptional regulator